jgi:hypothetical protein
MVLPTYLHAAGKGLACEAVERVACQLEWQPCCRPWQKRAVFGVLIGMMSCNARRCTITRYDPPMYRSPAQIQTELEALVRMRAIRQHLCDKTFATSRSNICRYDRETCKRNGS